MRLYCIASEMRSMLMTVMLIIVAVTIYNSTVGGQGGTKEKVKDSGGKVNISIESINP